MRWATMVGSVLAACAFGLSAQAGDDHQDDHKDDPHLRTISAPLLAPFKALAGDWTGKMIQEGKEIVGEATVNYKVTSNGSTIVETLGAGTPHEMVTVIHPDGDGLVLTHYCAIGNQPRMRATGKPSDKTVAFKFIDITNANAAKDMHMHNVTFTFISPDEFKTEWTNFASGKENGKVEFVFKRKK